MVKRTLAIAVLLVVATLGAGPAPLDRTAADVQVRQATSTLFTSYYRRLDPFAVLDAERTALLRFSSLPPIPAHVGAAQAPDIAVAQVDGVLARTHRAPAVVVATALKAMTEATHDRYTTFFTAREYHAFDEVLDPQKLSGIGILIDTDPQTTYARAFFVVPGTPADRAGLRSGDLLVSIGGRSTHGWNVAQTRSHLLGAAGTTVALTFRHAGERDANDVVITRENVQPPTVYFTMLPGHVAYLYVAAFGNATGREFKTAIARSETAGARAYVLDLRNDGGGIVGTALEILSQFVPSGPLVSIESNGGQIDTFEADDTAIAPKPLAVLVNQYSASASEITAAAIAESGTGILVGTRTFGKGVVQSVSTYPDGSALKVTTGRYFTPLNHDINGHGIVPGVVVRENAKAVFGIPEKDAQLRKALEVLGSQLSQNSGIVHS